MKRITIKLLFLIPLSLFWFTLSAQEAPWNFYIGVPIGKTTKTIFNEDATYKVEMPYTTFGLSVSMDKSIVEKQTQSGIFKQIGLTYGYSFSYLHGFLKKNDSTADLYNTISRWYDNPDKGMSQMTALVTIEGNTYLNTRFHFSLPFGLGATYAWACDKGTYAPCFCMSLRASYFVLDQLAVYAAYRWFASPKMRYEKTLLTNCSLLEMGVVYTVML